MNPLRPNDRSRCVPQVRITTLGGVSEDQAQGQGSSPFSILQAYGVYGRNVKQLELNDVRFDYERKDLRPAIFGENIGALELNRFRAQQEPGSAPQIQLAPQRKFLLDREEHLVLARPAGAVDFVRCNTQRRIGERAGDRDECLRGFGIERARGELGAEPPRDRQDVLERGARRYQRDRRLGGGRSRKQHDRQHREYPRDVRRRR